MPQNHETVVALVTGQLVEDLHQPAPGAGGFSLGPAHNGELSLYNRDFDDDYPVARRRCRRVHRRRRQRDAQQPLRNVLAYLDVPTLGQPEVFVRFKDDSLIDAGGNPETQNFLQAFVDRHVAWVRLH